ncbi:hypothetical protein SK128_022718, partial [Halocaridina rubra]
NKRFWQRGKHYEPHLVARMQNLNRLETRTYPQSHEGGWFAVYAVEPAEEKLARYFDLRNLYDTPNIGPARLEPGTDPKAMEGSSLLYEHASD